MRVQMPHAQTHGNACRAFNARVHSSIYISMLNCAYMHLSVCLFNLFVNFLVNGRPKSLLVHRKGSTRAFPPHHPLIPVDYQMTGQPVLIGGTMGSCSYVLTGTEKVRSICCLVY